MSTFVDPHLPMEAEARIEEASQTLIEVVRHTVLLRQVTGTLLQIHELVYNHLLSILTIEIHELIPETPGSD